MSTKHVLQALLILGLCGVAFSGYLSYRELFGAPTATACTPVGEPGTILGYPPCIYGLVMYLAIVVLATTGLRRVSRSGLVA